MSRSISLSARVAQEAQQTDEIEVVLFIIEHPDIPGGSLRLCSYPKERTSFDPLTYGIYSAWRTYNGSPFLFTIMDAVVPDEKDDAPSQASLVLELLDSDMGSVLTSTIVQATCHIAVVMASSPDVIEGEWHDLLLVSSDINSSQASLQFSTESLYDEPFPADRMTKERFPGLHR